MKARRLKEMLHSVKLLLNRKKTIFQGKYLGFKEISHPVKLHPTSPMNLIKELMKLRNKINNETNWNNAWCSCQLQLF